MLRKMPHDLPMPPPLWVPLDCLCLIEILKVSTLVYLLYKTRYVDYIKLAICSILLHSEVYLLYKTRYGLPLPDTNSQH